MKAPDAYWKLIPEEKAEIVNGCGPKGSGYLVPDTNWGLNITPV